MESPGNSRLLWIDHLRTFVILLVVNMHACVAFGHIGDWYYMAPIDPSLREKILFLFWQVHLQSFFMGILFFIAGYFACSAIARRGAAGFLRERLGRLGIPTLFYMMVIHPFILVGINPWRATFPQQFLRKFYLHGRFIATSGPMWFAFALLIFSALWAAGWSAAPLLRRGSGGAKEQSRAPSGHTLFRFALALGLATFLFRLDQPLGTSILNFQLGYFAQYILAFIAGLVAARRGWLVALARSKTARTAGWLGLIGGPTAFLVLLYVLQRQGIPDSQYLGGWNAAAFALAFWEQLTGVGLALGALALCARFFDRESASLRWMSDRSFGVYLLHPPILIALTLVVQRLPSYPVFQAILLTLLALGGSFFTADLVRRIPGAKRFV